MSPNTDDKNVFYKAPKKVWILFFKQTDKNVCKLSGGGGIKQRLVVVLVQSVLLRCISVTSHATKYYLLFQIDDLNR